MATNSYDLYAWPLLAIAAISACSSQRHENSDRVTAAGGFGDGGGAGGQSPGGSAGTDGGVQGAGGSAGTSGSAGSDGSAGTTGGTGSAGSAGTDDGGAVGASGTGGAGGSDPQSCCPTGRDCLCRGPAPSALTAGNGPFKTESFRIAIGSVFHPTDAEPPFASIALIARAGASGPELNAWGTFYASHGIVMLLVLANGSDRPAEHATRLLDGIEQLKAENTRSGSPLLGKLSERFGVAGYSIAAGGTTLASSSAPSLKTSVTLAVWGGDGSGVQVPTLLLCGETDSTAPCSMSESVYSAIPATTPKMMVSVAGATHFSWFSPTAAGSGIAGEVALAFQKVFLEGDERYRPLLLQSRGMVTTTLR